MPLHCLTRRGVSTKHRYDGLSPCSLNREYPSQSDFLPDSLRRKFTQSLKRLIPSYVARDCYILSRLLLSLESPRCFLPAFTRGELSPGEPRLDEKSSAALSKVLPLSQYFTVNSERDPRAILTLASRSYTPVRVLSS